VRAESGLALAPPGPISLGVLEVGLLLVVVVVVSGAAHPAAAVVPGAAPPAVAAAAHPAVVDIDTEPRSGLHHYCLSAPQQMFFHSCSCCTPK